MTDSDLVATPRELFAERFALLYAEAGNPPLKRVTESVARARRLDEGGRQLRVPAQRISDWRRGRNVPARFAGLAAVLEVLIGEARKRRPDPVTPGLYEVDDWAEHWSAALASPLAVEDAPLPRRTEETALCPYRGLAAFRQTDADWFFGRERATEDLHARLRAAYLAGGFVVIVGASGAGKSSLLRAGLGTALAPGTLADGQQTGWPTVVLNPGADPLKELVGQVAELAEPIDAALRAGSEATVPAFASEARAAAEVFARRAGGENAGVVLVVDQFEEAFTLSDDEDARLLFVRTLHAICTPGDGDAHPPVLVVLGVRADFYDRCLAYPEIVDAMQGQQMALGAMSVTELREVILRPAKALGLQAEPGLVDLMLTDLGASVRRGTVKFAPAGYEAGALPLLSHALLATWQRRTAGKLTVAGYRDTGGIRGAVAATGERAWGELDEAARTAARTLLLHLVQVGDTSRDVRRRATRRELVDQHGDSTAAERALEVLTTARLVTADAHSVELTHEALLDAWPRLRGWIDDNRASNLARQRLEADAKAWDEQARDASLLYRGARLETAQRHAADDDAVATTPTAEEFLLASARHRRRAVWLRRAAIALICVFAVIAAGAARIAMSERDDAEFGQLVTEADRQADIDPSLAARLTLAAHRLRPGDESLHTRLLSTQHTALATSLEGHAGAVYLTSFSPDGDLLATASYDRTARLWDVSDRTDPRPISDPLTGHDDWVSAAVFSPDGTILATAGNDGTVRLWDVSDPKSVEPVGEPLAGGHGTVYLVDFSRDGTTLVTANEDSTAQLWDITDPAAARPLGEPLAGHDGQVRSVAFSPVDDVVATTGDDDTIRLWDVSDPQSAEPLGRRLTGHDDDVHSVAFSPDGSMVASGSSDRTVRLWDVADGTQLGLPLMGHTAPVWSVKFSPDGTTLASSGEDSTARLWNVTAPDAATELGPPLVASADTTFAVGFSPDGRTLATGNGDTLVRLWSLPEAMLLGHTADVMMPAFRPDGRVLATGGRDATVRLWEVTPGAGPAPLGEPLRGHENYVTRVVFRDDGQLLASASGDNTVRLWDVTDPATASPLGDPIELATRYTSPLDISSAAQIMVTGHDDESVRLWDISSPAEPVALGEPLTGHVGYVHQARFSPDGRTLVTVGADHTVRLWDVTDPAQVAPLGEPLTGHTGEVFAAAFRADGAVLATASGDHTVRLWDVSDVTRADALGEPLSGHTEEVTSLAFNADGSTLVTGSGDTTIRLWDVADPASAGPIGGALTANVVAHHQVAFSPQEDVIATGGADRIVRLWELDVDQVVERICTTTRGVLTEEQWEQHVPQLGYAPPCD